jgi:maltose O-acetyltransferase
MNDNTMNEPPYSNERRRKRRLIWWFQKLRIAKYRFLSDCHRVVGNPTCRQPVQFVGDGVIRFKGRIKLGVNMSPFYLNGYIYIEARSPDSVVEFGDGVWVNNNSFFISDGPGIFIGDRTTIGINCEIIDSDFHDLHPDRRIDGIARTGKVVIGENVMIGSNVRIMKGVTIGKNSVIANGAVITRSVPENALAYGNPGRCGPLIDLAQWSQK